MSTHVDQRGACAVGAADEIDPIVAECFAYFVQIVHRDRRGIEREVRVKLRLALPHALYLHIGDVPLRHFFFEDTRVHDAVEGMGRAGPSLVHEDHVAIFADLSEAAKLSWTDLACRRARTPGEEEDGIGQRRRIGCRQYHDLQRDPSTALRLPILPDFQHTTATFGNQRSCTRKLRLWTGLE